MTSVGKFRPLNLAEQVVLTSAIAKGRKGLRHPNSLSGMLYAPDYPKLLPELQVSYEHLPGNFLVCLILREGELGSCILWRGVSRRSYRDRPNRIRGEMLAFSRAVFHSYGVEI